MNHQNVLASFFRRALNVFKVTNKSVLDSNAIYNNYANGVYIPKHGKKKRFSVHIKK